MAFTYADLVRRNAAPILAVLGELETEPCPHCGEAIERGRSRCPMCLGDVARVREFRAGANARLRRSHKA